MSGARATADCQSVGQHGSVHRANARGADAVEVDTFVLKETIQDSPGNSTVRTPPWSAKLIRFRLGELPAPPPSWPLCLCSFSMMPISMQTLAFVPGR